MQKVIERLRREKAAFEEEGKRAQDLKTAADEEQRQREFNAGKEAALEWVKTANYEEISLYKRYDERVAGYHDPEMIKQIQNKHKCAPAWAKGWLEGVREVLDAL
jgi:hypothetical protein